jgi:hypothetical protein
MKIYKLQPPGGTISADSIDCSYDHFEGTGQIDGIDNLTTDQKAEELEKAGLIKLYRNKEEIEDAIASLDIDLIWEAVGPDAYENHHAVGIKVRALIAEENWAELGRIIGTGAKAYLRPFAADEIEARTYD